MLPKKLHIQEIENFHNRMDEVSKQVDAFREEHGDNITAYPKEVKERAYNLSLQYFELTQLWSKIDDFVEFTIKHRIDVLKNEPMKNWNQ